MLLCIISFRDILWFLLSHNQIVFKGQMHSVSDTGKALKAVTGKLRLLPSAGWEMGTGQNAMKLCLGSKGRHGSFQTNRHPLYGFLSKTTLVAGTRKIKPVWILIKQKMMGWQWHQLDHMQIICISLQTDTTPAPHHSIFCSPAALSNVQKKQKQCQSTECINMCGLNVRGR